MPRNEVFKIKKSKLINLVILAVVLVFIWLNLNIGISIPVIVLSVLGSILYVNKVMSTITVTNTEIIYESFLRNKKIKFSDIIGLDCRKRILSRFFKGSIYPLGPYSKLVLVGDDEGLFIIGSLYNQSSHLWYIVLKELIGKKIYKTDEVDDAYHLILKRGIGES